MTAKNHILLCFLFIYAFCLSVFGQKYRVIEHAELKNLDNSFIYTIIQDNNGYLWIGTSEGLFRFDGFKLNAFSTSDSLADNFITCSYKTDKGLWFGHMNGSLSYYNGSKFREIIPLKSGNSIANLVESPDGSIWAGTFTGGILQLGTRTIKKTYTFIKEEITIYSLCFISDQEVLIGSYDGIRLCSIDKEGIITINKYLNEIPKTKIQDIRKKNDNTGYYVLTQDQGIYSIQFENNRMKINRLDQKIKLPEGIQGFIEDKNSNLWLATFGHGLHKIIIGEDNSACEIVRIMNNYLNKTLVNIKTLYLDREENIWVGNYGSGIQKVVAQTFSFSSFSNKQFGNNISAIWIDNEYKWIGTEKGIIKSEIANAGNTKFLGKKQGLPDDGTSALYAEGNNLWIGYMNSGVYQLNRATNAIVKKTIHEGILENNITCLTGTGKDLWIGTKKGLCYLDLHTDSIKWYTINQGGLPHNFIKHVFIDSRQKVWITTLSNTVSHIDNNILKRISITSENSTVTLESIAEDIAGNIWVGSIGRGVFLIQKDSIVNLTTEEGLFSDYCYSLIGDSSGYIWVGHRGGLSRINTRDFSIKTIHKISETEEITNFNPNAIFLGPDKKLWFGMNNGLLTSEPLFGKTMFVPPIINITSLIINNKDYQVKDKIRLSPGKHKIKIDFIGISLKNPEKVKYQYRLTGYDDEWSNITYTNSVTYPRLTEGTYTFEVNASNSDGITTKQPKKIQFIIRTPFYKRFYTYIILLIALSLLIYVHIKRREFIHRHEKLSLEKKVQERTLEIQRQKKEIEMQRDLIHSKNNDIMDSLKYARKLQSSFTPPEELLLKLFPEHFLITKPKDIVSGDFCWYTKTQDLSIVTVADCTGHGVPGAIMSILGITSLNDIIINYGITNPDRVLELLRLKVITSLRQHAKEGPSLDGMNLGLCVIDRDTLKIQFSGALNNLVHIQNRKLQIVRADRIPIGFSYHEDKPFTCHELQGKKGDILYLFSDGFQDQFGGNEDKKYSSRRFIKTLYSIHNKPLDAQKRELEDILLNWMKDKEQTDDITILGFKL